MKEYMVILSGKKREEVFWIWAGNRGAARTEAMKNRSIKTVISYEVFSA